MSDCNVVAFWIIFRRMFDHWVMRAALLLLELWVAHPQPDAHITAFPVDPIQRGKRGDQRGGSPDPPA